MAQPLLLEGQYEREPEVDKLQELRDDLDQFMEQTLAAMSIIRNQLDTIRAGLAHATGEIVVTGNVPPAPQFDQRWEAWKQKLGPGTAPSRVIDALLKHGPLNRTQLRQAGELGWATLDAATARLRNLSLIEKIGDRWNLKTS